MSKGFEEFEPIFGEATAVWESPNSLPLLPFLFHIHALDALRLRIHVTDFHSYTWESVRSIQQLEDLRDDIGIGGSWSEFVDYLITSVKSGDVKLVLGGPSKIGRDNGATFAKFVAHKAKGMPHITIALNRLMDSSANDAMSNLSLELYKAFRSKHNLVIKEQERAYQLTKTLSAEKEKNESIQNQLDAVLSSKKQKLRKSNVTEKALSISGSLNVSDTMSVSDTHDSPVNLSSQAPVSTKVNNKVVPAYRRAKVRGVLLQDTEDGED